MDRPLSFTLRCKVSTTCFALILCVTTGDVFAEGLGKALNRIKQQTATNLSNAAGAVKHIAPVAPAAVVQGQLYAVKLAPEDDLAVVEALKAQILKTDAASTIIAMPDVLRVKAIDGEVLNLKPLIQVARSLVFEPQTNTYSGSIKVGVSPIEGIGVQKKLSTPIVFEVLDSGVAKEAVASVDTTAPPFKEISLKFAGVPATAHVSSSLHPEGVEVPFPAVRVIIQSPTIEGFGVQTTMVNVSISGVTPLKGHPIILKASNGKWMRQQSETDANGVMSAELRSESYGPAVVTAIVPDVGQGEDNASFIFPTLTIRMAILGGIGGGLIRLLQKRRFGVVSFLKGLLVAVLVGALAFVLYVVGVNVLPINPTVTQGSILVLALSAVGAYLGNLRIGGPAN